MSLRKFPSLSILFLFAVLATPRSASADWMLTPFVGWNFGGAADTQFIDFTDEFEQKANFGVSLTWMGAGVFGFEFDLGFTPNFFENTEGQGDFQFGDNNVTTFMGNLIIGLPFGGQQGGGFRPFALAGAGLIKSRIGDAGDFFNVDSNDFGINVGGGALFFFSDNFGLRGDLRYFRSLQDEELDDDFNFKLADFRFWRATVGAAIRF